MVYVNELLNSQDKILRNSKVLILGVAYKKDISDMRESQSLDIIELLHDCRNIHQNKETLTWNPLDIWTGDRRCQSGSHVSHCLPGGSYGYVMIHCPSLFRFRLVNE